MRPLCEASSRSPQHEDEILGLLQPFAGDPDRAARVTASETQRSRADLRVYEPKPQTLQRRKQMRRCRTCSRLLYLVKRRVPPHGSKYCDPVCKNHSPKYRVTRFLYPEGLLLTRSLVRTMARRFKLRLFCTVRLHHVHYCLKVLLA